MKTEELKKTRTYLRYKDANLATLTVPKAWCVRFDLTPTELMIFEEIHQATHYWQQACYCASRTSLAVIVNASLPTVDKALLNLERKGFIWKDVIRFKVRNGERRQVSYKSTLPAKVLASDKEIEKILETNITGGIASGRIKTT